MPTNRWTKSQEEAVTSVDQSVAVIAGAGSGKTEVLTERLLHVLKSGKTSLDRILAITFTEKAAGELKRRIARKIGPEEKEELPWAAIGTFHSFCYEMLKEFAPLVGFAENSTVWDEPTAKLAVHRTCRRVLLEALREKGGPALDLIEALDFRHTLLLLEELMHFRWHAEKTWEQTLVTEDKREKALGLAAQTLYWQCCRTYSDDKKERQVLDFQDLEILALELLRNNKEVCTQLQKRFTHIFVDEVQDISDQQHLLIQALHDPKRNKLCVVGDPKQSIYRFRGANPRAFYQLTESIANRGGKIIELKDNFRSEPTVIDFVNNAFHSLLSEKEFIPLQATKEHCGGGVTLLHVIAPPKAPKEELRKAEAEQIVRLLLTKKLEEEKKWGDFALLFQSLTHIRIYTQAFQQAGIPLRLHGGRGFLNAQEISDLLFILKLMIEPEDRMALIGLMRSPMIGMEDPRITQLTLEHPHTLGKELLKQKEAAWLKRLYAKKDSWSAATLLEEALFVTAYPALLHTLDPSGSKSANVEQLVALVRDLETGEEMGLEELVEYFEELKKRNTPFSSPPATDLSDDCCQLMTVHAAKGLEFPVVILPDLLRGSPVYNGRALFVRDKGVGFYLKDSESPFAKYFPTEKTKELLLLEKQSDLEERKRLLYVALTRAKEEIILPEHKEATRVGPWYKWVREAAEMFPDKKILEPQESRTTASSLAPDFNFSPHLLPSFEKETRHITVTDLKRKKGDLPQKRRFRKKAKHGLSAAQLGDVVHHVLKGWPYGEKADLAELFRKAVINLEAVASKEDEAAGARLLENFLNSTIAPPHWEGEHEFPFRLKLKGYEISGVVDYLYETPKGWVVCDFKTDAEPNPSKYKMQMDVYALALIKGLEKPLIETRLLFLKGNKAFIEPVTQERLQATERTIEKWIRNRSLEN